MWFTQMQRTEEAQKFMKRLSLVSVGFDEQLAAHALEANDYDITSAVQYCQEQQDDDSLSQSGGESIDSTDSAE